ncbi:hypothetical protein [Shewanella maritima]|uniref:hypothetical protein n=1 Tax=Shewanella maritima TaxID=2520507 RepID=UPI003736CB10
MTFDNDIEQQSILETLFGYIQSEDFEQGFHWAKTQAQLDNSPVIALIDQLESDPKIKPRQCESLAEKDKLLLFCASYSLARHLVEESNWYSKAETLVRSGITALEAMPFSALNTTLQKFAAIQIDICTIDRGIYTSQDWLMAAAAENIEVHLASVAAVSNDLNGIECQLYSKYLLTEFNAYRHFMRGVAIVAELYRIRWEDPVTLKQQMNNNKATFDQAVDALTADDKYIMSTDLESLWPPLAFFSENRPQGSGELFVERGAISISYFASVNHIVTRELRQALAKLVKDRPAEDPLHLCQWGCDLPQRNMLNDIWAGIAKDFEDIYSWQLPSLDMPFRDRDNIGKQLEFDVELIYYPMGIFALNLKAQLDDVSASGVRHAMSLGTPFAMDQQMSWNGEKVGLFEEFAEERFTELAETLNHNFDHFEKSVKHLLTFNSIENRYVSTRLDRMVEKNNGQTVGIGARALKQHFAYPALVLPQRELRSAVDDWCLRTVTSEEHNINKDCYNHDEFVYTNRHECVLGLLEQPNWVLEQSSEMMDVAAAITNMFHLTNTLLSQQLTQSLNQAVPALKQKNISAKVLRGHVQKLETEKECLRQFTNDAHWLLDLINAGSMMTFPDHSSMVKKVFQQMDFENLHIRTQDTLNKIQYRQEEIITETARIYEQLQTRNSKRFTRILSGSMALISVGALKDIFDILNGSNMGINISGELQVSIVTFFGIMLIILLINKNETK